MADQSLSTPEVTKPTTAPNPLNEIDWSMKSDVEVLNTRRSLAKAFEAFLISSMGAGVVPPEMAQDTATLFVKMFENATTREGLSKALDTMDHGQNVLLNRFSLRVAEMKQKAICKGLYAFLVSLVHKNQIGLARELFSMYDKGSITSTEQMETLASLYGLRADALEIVNQLKVAKLDAQAQNLLNDLNNNRIQTEVDLQPWRTLNIGNKSENIKATTPKVIGLLAPDPTMMDRAIDWVYRVENGIRDIAGKNRIAPKKKTKIPDVKAN